MDVGTRITRLRLSVEQYKPEQPVEWQVGRMANAMIEQAKQRQPEDPVLAAIQPFTPMSNEKYIAGMSASAVAAVLSQLEAAQPEPTTSAVAAW